MAAVGDLTWWCRKDRKIVQHDKVLKLRLETSFSGFFFFNFFCQKTPHPPHSTKERTNRSQFQSLEKGSLSHTTLRLLNSIFLFFHLFYRVDSQYSSVYILTSLYESSLFLLLCLTHVRTPPLAVI